MTTTSPSPAAGDKSRNPEAPYDKLTIGVCPDQWGVWFPEDEKQIPWRTALGEMAEAASSPSARSVPEIGGSGEAPPPADGCGRPARTRPPAPAGGRASDRKSVV